MRHRCKVRVMTHCQGRRAHMRSQVLFDGSTGPELVARSDQPESGRRAVGADPSMDLTVLVVARILILVIHLEPFTPTRSYFICVVG